MEEESSTFFTKKRVIILISAVVLLAVGAVLLLRGSWPFSDKNNGNNADGFSSDTVPEMKDPPAYNNVYYEINPDKPLLYVSAAENFSGVFNITYSYNTQSSYRTYFVVSSADKFLIKNDSYTTIFDGKRLYTKTPLYTLTEDRDKYTLFDELGIPSLDSLKEMISSEKASVELSEDGMEITVNIAGNDGLTKDEYVVSAENGIVISAKTFFGDEIRRECSFENISVLSEKDFQPDTFTIPD